MNNKKKVLDIGAGQGQVSFWFDNEGFSVTAIEPDAYNVKLINEKLKGSNFLSADKQTVTDLSIFPFIRQFAFVDKDYFDKLPYPHLQKWLQYHLQSELFQNIMTKYDPWHEGQDIIYFP